ncbi:hypothetical protein GCM10010451_60960 [Streptomyces virens]|uniref:DUF3291 domain-containing protein n=1 Tax=Streptomyces virens TaxID=285572 RepID=A0ABP6Q8L7_9ACTN|nr:hypothetical protein [Streptomyces calvus]
MPSGHRPTVAEAEARIPHLRANGPAPYAFTLRTSFSPGAAQPLTGEVPEGLGCSA